jgi:hypothetical protein
MGLAAENVPVPPDMVDKLFWSRMDGAATPGPPGLTMGQFADIVMELDRMSQE